MTARMSALSIELLTPPIPLAPAYSSSSAFVMPSGFTGSTDAGSISSSFNPRYGYGGGIGHGRRLLGLGRHGQGGVGLGRIDGQIAGLTDLRACGNGRRAGYAPRHRRAVRTAGAGNGSRELLAAALCYGRRGGRYVYGADRTGRSGIDREREGVVQVGVVCVDRVRISQPRRMTARSATISFWMRLYLMSPLDGS